MSFLNLFNRAPEKPKAPEFKTNVHPSKMGEFKVLASMAGAFSSNYKTMTEEEKAATLRAFWNRWDDFVQIDRLRAEEKAMYDALREAREMGKNASSQ